MMKCDNQIDGSPCGAEITKSRGFAQQRGVSVELVECANGCKRQLQRTEGGVVIQVSTGRKTPHGMKTQQKAKLYRWQRELIKRLGHTPQSYLDARLEQDAARERGDIVAPI